MCNHRHVKGEGCKTISTVASIYYLTSLDVTSGTPPLKTLKLNSKVKMQHCRIALCIAA